jgi:uncharacterized protein YndB with AHSA1/START domain
VPGKRIEMHGTIVIGQPAETVFAFLADAENEALWRPDLTVRRVSSPRGTGARYVRRVRVWRGPARERLVEVSEHEPPRALAFRLVDDENAIDRYALESVDGGTRVTMTVTAEARGLIGRFLRSLAREIPGALDDQLQRLKRVLEAAR